MCCNLAHNWPFTFVSITAGTEHQDNTIFCNSSRCRQELLEGIRGMGIINDNIILKSFDHPLKAPWHRLKVCHTLLNVGQCHPKQVR